MRALLCHCRQHLEASDDEALCAVVRERLILRHPDIEPTQDRVEEIVATRAYDFEYKELYPDVEFVTEPYRVRPDAGAACSQRTCTSARR